MQGVAEHAAERVVEVGAAGRQCGAVRGAAGPRARRRDRSGRVGRHHGDAEQVPTRRLLGAAL